MDEELFQSYSDQLTTTGFSDIAHYLESDLLQHQHMGLSKNQVIADENHGIVEMSDIIKAQISCHPLYPDLVSAYIDCTKVGVPEEMTLDLQEMSKQNHGMFTSCTDQMGADPQLDDFMVSYCEILQKYKEELSKPFNEATEFLSSIQSQLNDLCRETLPALTNSSFNSPDGVSSQSDEDLSCVGEVSGPYSHQESGRQDNHEIKEMLMNKYSGYISKLKTEFLKKRKKGELPKTARTALVDWWNSHYKWPYPTEEEKNKLTEITGLNHKQINNWFINQRKRHWKPSEDMRFALMECSSSNSNTRSMYFSTMEGT